MNTAYKITAIPEVLDYDEKTIYKDGSFYFGYKRNGKRHGLGLYLWPEGYGFYGEWRDGELIKGKGIDRDRNVYEGEWKDGKGNGYGKMTYLDGSVYDGEWMDGKENGLGYIIKRGKKSHVLYLKVKDRVECITLCLSELPKTKG